MLSLRWAAYQNPMSSYTTAGSVGVGHRPCQASPDRDVQFYSVKDPNTAGNKYISMRIVRFSRPLARCFRSSGM